MKSQKQWTPELSSERIDERLDKAKKRFIDSSSAQLVSFRQWCEEWDWAQRSDIYTHQLHSYPAKLLAYIPLAFLTSSLVAANDVVMDSFVGTGTVLLECLIHQFSPRNCYGVEINPLARLIAKVKTTPLNIDRLNHLSVELFAFISRTKSAPLPDFDNRDFWFRQAAQRDLARIRYCIDNLDASSDDRDFFRVSFSAIIRDMSRADPDIAPPVLLKLEKFPKKRQEEISKLLHKKQKANAVTVFRAKVKDNLQRMNDFVEVLGASPKTKSQIIWDDARDEIKLGRYVEAGVIDKSNAPEIGGSIGMVITSPPYIAAQKYVRTTRLELLWLGLASEDEVRTLDRFITGTERVPANEKTELVEVGNVSADKLLKGVYQISPERAAIASRYYRDMRRALTAIHTVLKPSGICVLVVGNNKVCGRVAKNHRILSEIAGEANRFSTEFILRDPIRSRGMLTTRHETADLIDDEFVLVLRKQGR